MMNEEKEIITFDELYHGKKVNTEKKTPPENKRGYVYTLLVYGIIMYVVATIIVLLMLEIPKLTGIISEAEVLISEVADDVDALAVVMPDIWNEYRDLYKNDVEVIGYYNDYVVLVNAENEAVEETLFTALPDGVTYVLDIYKVGHALVANGDISTWDNGNDIVRYRAQSLTVPLSFTAEAYVIEGGMRYITDTASSLLNFIIYILLIPGIIYFMKKDLVYDLKELKAQKFEVILPIIIGYAYVWVGNIVSTVLSTYLSGLFGMQISEAANQEAIISAVSSDLGILMIISAVFIGPVIEELVFRKALFGLIKKDSVALFVSTLIFGLIHVVTEQSIAAALINGSSYFVMGFVFGYIYIKANRNVMIPTIVHIINNAVSILVILIIL
jgi:membrane protease YdiL (CAAX protease family)